VTRTALVTGGARGLGLRTAQRLVELGLSVVVAGRNPALVAAVAEELGCAGVELDVSDAASVERTVEHFEGEGIGIDVLVNNAALCVSDGPLSIPVPELGEQMATNVLGPWLLMRAFVPWMVERGYGRVVNVSSEAGSFASGPSLGAYGVSKAALNALTATTSAEVPTGVDVLVNSVCPGWVATDMGGPGAPRGIDEGAEGIVWAATLPEGGPRGGFFRDGHRLPW
jgi:NAD(P)-dependent dehydrogenase (short-subunit alcohol dehydrogenase family)